MKDTAISWTHHTFNPWWGCTKVSAGCTHCYAETFSKRTGRSVWGKDAPRRFLSDDYWAQPLKWNAEAEKAGERRRVFCASMADVFEDRDDLIAPRTQLFRLIRQTPWLDWQLLTKRPENIAPLIHASLVECTENPMTVYDAHLYSVLDLWLNGAPPSNVWLGTTVENQEAADKRIALLAKVPAVVRFLSVEPMLGPVNLMEHFLVPKAEDEMFKVYPDCGRALSDKLHWIICGGESGGKRRPFEIEWAQSLYDQCKAAGVPFFMKQDSAFQSGQQGRLPDELWNCKEFPKVQVPAC